MEPDTAPSHLVFVTTAVLEEPPISINKAYSVWMGSLRLTKAGKAFKDALAAAVSRSSTDWKKAVDSIYQHGGWATLHITLYFNDLVNKTWKPGRKTKAGNFQNPLKKKDASNYVKLIEDAVSRGSGIDDCNHIDVLVRKRLDAERPRVEVTLATYVESGDAYVELMDT